MQDEPDPIAFIAHTLALPHRGRGLDLARRSPDHTHYGAAWAIDRADVRVRLDNRGCLSTPAIPETARRSVAAGTPRRHSRTEPLGPATSLPLSRHRRALAGRHLH